MENYIFKFKDNNMDNFDQNGLKIYTKEEIELYTGEYDNDGYYLLPLGDYFDPAGYYYD